MKTLLVVARRELLGHWMWLILIAVVALLPLLGPVVGLPDRDAQGTVALALACILALVSTLALGASILARDALGGRLGFFLSRPIPWWSLWGGKFLAAFALAAASLAVFAPAGIAIWGTFKLIRNAADPLGAVVFVSWIIIGLSVGQWLLVAIGSRSAWLILDLVCVGTAVSVASRLTSWFPEAADALSLALVSAGGFAALLSGVALVFLAASAAQYAFGRVSLGRCHAAGSLTLWGGLAILVGGIAVYAQRPVTPADFELVWNAAAPPEGSWITVQGRMSRVFVKTMLFDTITRRHVPLTNAGGPFFSADGSAASWDEWRGSEPALGSVIYARLNAGDIHPTRLTVPPLDIPSARTAQWSPLVLSPSGNRLVIPRISTLDVYSMPAGTRVGSVALGSPTVRRQVFFLDEDHLRAYVQRTANGPTEILDATLPEGKPQVTGQLYASGHPWVSLNANGERALVWEWSLGRLTLHEARSGRRLATLVEGTKPIARQAAFLADGRIAFVRVENGAAHLDLLTPSGERERTVGLGPAWRTILGGEPTPGRLFVGLQVGASHDVVLVDLASGDVLRRDAGLKPINLISRPGVPAGGGGGGVGARLFLDSQGRLVRLDPDTGKREVLTGTQG
jgi:hypothetical protein